MPRKILYISYDGMTDPLGQSQVIPYLIGLSEKGYSFHLISCEKPVDFSPQEKYVRKILEENNIVWHPLPYTKSPPVLSTLRDIFRMKRKAFQLHRKENFSLVHCRSYIASLIGLSMKRKTGIKFLFDMRGFWADERVEGGLWNLKNPLYKLMYNYFKKKETQFFSEANYTISLTQAGEREIHNWKNISRQPIPIEMIPCCADFELFSPENINQQLLSELKNRFSIRDKDFVLSYIGSVSTWYRLDEMFRFFKFIQKKKNSAKFLFVTKDSYAPVLAAVKRNEVKINNLIITSSSRKDMPTFLALSHLSVFFYKAGFSRSAVSPTKQAEVMGMGIPHICNAGVGDVEMIVKESGAGYAMIKFDDAEFEKAFSFVSDMKLSREEIRRAGIKFYSLEAGVDKYESVYRKIIF